MTRSELEGLLERVEKAEGPHEGIDVDIWEKIDRKASARSDYTASIDAAVALVERCLPGKWWDVDSTCNASIGDFRGRDGGCLVVYGQATTPPLAILSALLRALLAQEDKG